MLNYFKPIYHDDLVISIDNIILDVALAKPEMRDLLECNISCMANTSMVEVLRWENYKPGTFRYQTTFRIDDGKSFWMGHGLNGKGIQIERYRLDWNPNKVAENPTFLNVHGFLLRNSRETQCKVPRFDLAIDIPAKRSDCFLVKDRRLYIERRHGVELTQYLGSKSSTVGRVKLYNKTAEAKLNYPLTRLELTLDPTKPYEEINFPVVYRVDSEAVAANELRITDTDRFILNAVLHGCGMLNDLGRKTRLKIENILGNFVKPVALPKSIYEIVLQQLSASVTRDR